jgi:pentose-5-phosphate-3-epimerase/putative flippase GtrA
MPSLRLRHGKRLFTHSQASYWLFRYRYLCTFTVIGFLSVLLEVMVVGALPKSWPWLARTLLGFALGLTFSFAGNASVNFHVPRSRLMGTFLRFALVSGLSFTLNLTLMSGVTQLLPSTYGPARLGSAAMLFVIAYTLHRRFTFDLSRNFGIAVYTVPSERVSRIFWKIGRNCDHVHIDLVDETMNPNAGPVDLSKIDDAKRYWPDMPFCLHVMSREPAKWLPQVWDKVDWVLVHLGSDDDLMPIIAECRRRDKKIGVVWHTSDNLGEALPYLPHVDFVMILGIASPGKSGQQLLERAVEVAEVLDRMRCKYGYEVMFDGGVKTDTVQRIPAKYIVAASAVLQAENPIKASHTLRTGAKYDRRAA